MIVGLLKQRNRGKCIALFISASLFLAYKQPANIKARYIPGAVYTD
jgi:hypothetical protein